MRSHESIIKLGKNGGCFDWTIPKACCLVMGRQYLTWNIVLTCDLTYWNILKTKKFSFVYLDLVCMVELICILKYFKALYK